MMKNTRKEKKSISLLLGLLFSLVTAAIPTAATITVVSTIFSFNPNIHPLKHMFHSPNLIQATELVTVVMGKATE